MSVKIIILAVIILFAVIFFITELFSFDITALLILSALLVSGLLTVQESLSGFSNPATVTIGAIFVISEGVRKTGFLNLVSEFFSKLVEINTTLATAAIMIIISLVSTFINNTAAVVIFIPVIMTLSDRMKQSPSRLLMPLSFASIFGGICTLIGTSTNILVNSIAVKHGIKSLRMFDFAPVGIFFLGAGFIYMFTIGIRSIPERRKRENLTESFDMSEYVTDIELTEGFSLDGKTVEEIKRKWGLDLDVIHVYRRGQVMEVNMAKTSIHKGDLLRVRGSIKEIASLKGVEGIKIMPSRHWEDRNFEEENHTLVEVAIAPECACVTQMIDNTNLYEKFGAVILGIRSRGRVRHTRLGKMRLSAGDTVLMSITYSQIDAIQKDPSFIMISDVQFEVFRRKKMFIALAILGSVIMLPALGLFPIAAAAVCGVALLVLTGCLTSEEVYESINWRIVFLLAGVIPLGVAIDKSGLAGIFADFFVNILGGLGPRAVMSGFFLIVMLVSSVVNNQATAAIFAPIAIQAAEALGVSPYPMIMAVAYAASLSFITPVGYHTNTIIYNTGHYKFSDFVKIGAPLNVIFWLIATLVIPLIWKF